MGTSIIISFRNDPDFTLIVISTICFVYSISCSTFIDAVPAVGRELFAKFVYPVILAIFLFFQIW